MRVCYGGRKFFYRKINSGFQKSPNANGSNRKKILLFIEYIFTCHSLVTVLSRACHIFPGTKYVRATQVFSIFQKNQFCSSENSLVTVTVTLCVTNLPGTKIRTSYARPGKSVLKFRKLSRHGDCHEISFVLQETRNPNSKYSGEQQKHKHARRPKQTITMADVTREN